MTENGPNPKLKEYGLVECVYDGYPVRTGFNVRDSDATVFFGEKSPGYYTTYRAADEYNKEMIRNPTIESLIIFIQSHHISILNVAGNRLSKLSNEDIEMIQENLFTVFSNFAHLKATP